MFRRKELRLLGAAALIHSSTAALAANMQAAGPPPAPREPATMPVVGVSGECAVVPMALVSNIPTIEVRIDGRGPYQFAIDTGASGHGRIGTAVAEALKLKVVAEVRTPAPGGAVAMRSVFGAPSIAVGGVSFTDVHLVAASTVRGPTPPWYGILGIGMFHDRTLTIDYANGFVRIDRTPVRNGVSASFEDGIPTLPVQVAARTFNVDLDTGNGASPLFLKEADARALPIEGTPIERGRAKTSFGEFSIMEATLGAPIMIGGFELPMRIVGWPTPRGDGNIGSRALKGTVLQVDRTAGKVAVGAPGPALRCA